MAITTARTDATTEVAPFTPQNHGASCIADFPAALIPRGNAMPINTPITLRSNTAAATLAGVDASKSVVISLGVTTPHAARTPRQPRTRHAPPTRRSESATLVESAEPTPAAPN